LERVVVVRAAACFCVDFSVRVLNTGDGAACIALNNRELPDQTGAPGEPTGGSKVCARITATTPRDLALRVASFVRSAIDDESGVGVDEYRGAHLVAHFSRVSIVVDGINIDLTRRELALLQFIVTHKNKALSRSDILAHVWPQERILLLH
jgi:hypothetical protein